MNKMKYLLASIVTLAMLAVTVEFNLFESEFLNSQNLPFKISMHEAHAQDVAGYEMTTETCWETGEPIQICRAADWFCDVGDQGTCSPDPNPGEG